MHKSLILIYRGREGVGGYHKARNNKPGAFRAFRKLGFDAMSLESAKCNADPAKAPMFLGEF
jgi:hypothetical protein